MSGPSWPYCLASICEARGWSAGGMAATGLLCFPAPFIYSARTPLGGLGAILSPGAMGWVRNCTVPASGPVVTL